MDDLTVGVGSEVIFGKGQQQQQQRMAWHGMAAACDRWQLLACLALLVGHSRLALRSLFGSGLLGRFHLHSLTVPPPSVLIAELQLS